MKKSLSKNKQNNVWVKKQTDTHFIVKLRRNHEQIKREEEDYWQCDEVVIEIPLRQGVEQYIEDNFDALFEMHTPELAWAKYQELLK